MLRFLLIYNSAQWCTMGKVWVLMRECICCGSTGPAYCFHGVELCRNEGKCIRKSFSGRWNDILLYLSPARPSSALLLSKVSHTLVLSSAHLSVFALVLSNLCDSYLFFFFSFYTPHCPPSVSLPLLLLLGLWNSVSPWRMSQVWKPLIGINECTFRSFSCLLGGVKIRPWKSVGERKRNRGESEVKRETKKIEIGAGRERLHIKGAFVHY